MKLCRYIYLRLYHYFKRKGRYTFFGRIVERLFRRQQVIVYKKKRGQQLPKKVELEQQRTKEFTYKPKISIVVPLYKTPIPYLDQLIQSIQHQTYENWELCLSDGSGSSALLQEALARYQKDSRVHVVVSKEPLKIAENTNQAITLATGDYIAFADHDDALAEYALYECVAALNENPNIDLLYSDEDKMLANGKEFLQPFTKPDFDLDYLRTTNYICHLMVVKRELLDQVGGLRPEFDGAQDYDLVLRLVEVAKQVHHIPKVLYHWRLHKGSTSGNPANKKYAYFAGAKAINEHYKRMGIDAVAVQGDDLGEYKVMDNGRSK